MRLAGGIYVYVQSKFTFGLITQLFVFCMLHPIAANSGSVQCNCPTISAKGTGNSSCSASESSGSCTVDYNTFDPKIEQDAADLLKRVSGVDVQFQRFDFSGQFRGFDMKAARTVVSNDGSSALMDQIMVYALVSFVQNSGDNVAAFDSEIATVYQVLRDNSDSFANAFLFPGAIEQEDGVTVTNGCMEFQTSSGDVWAMYKAFWSEKAPSPQCGS